MGIIEIVLGLLVVAVVAHVVIGMPWAPALVLGIVISPTDVVAATAVAERLKVPRRIVTILEGEGLLNDAITFVTYRLAVAAAVRCCARCSATWTCRSRSLGSSCKRGTIDAA